MEDLLPGSGINASVLHIPGITATGGVYGKTLIDRVSDRVFRRETGHGLALLQQKGSDLPIYSDSRNAISWVKKKKCKTLLARKPINEPIFDLIERAEKWLNTHTYTTQILKWETSVWGEIPADFGRK